VQFEEVLVDDYTTEDALVVTKECHIGSTSELVIVFNGYLEVM